MKDASAPGRLSGFARGRGRRSCSSRHRGVLLLGKLHRKDGQLVEKYGRQREGDLADRVGRGQHRGDHEHAENGVAAVALQRGRT
jgi:hypothetical protein